MGLVILIGESGSGKDAVLNTLVNEYGFERIVTATTRPVRDGEVNGVDYFFMSKEDFEKGIKHNDFIEHREYSTLVGGNKDIWYYGSPKQELSSGKDYVIILDVQGAKDYTAYYGEKNCTVIQLQVSDEIREQRAMQRGSFDKTEWDRRLADDKIKFSEDQTADIIDGIVSNEGDFNETCCEVYDLYKKEQIRKLLMESIDSSSVPKEYRGKYTLVERIRDTMIMKLRSMPFGESPDFALVKLAEYTRIGMAEFLLESHMSDLELADSIAVAEDIVKSLTLKIKDNIPFAYSDENRVNIADIVEVINDIAKDVQNHYDKFSEDLDKMSIERQMLDKEKRDVLHGFTALCVTMVNYDYLKTDYTQKEFFKLTDIIKEYLYDNKTASVALDYAVQKVNLSKFSPKTEQKPWTADKIADLLYKIINNSYGYYSDKFNKLDEDAKGKPEEFFVSANNSLLKEQGDMMRGLNSICYTIVDSEKETYTKEEFLILANALKETVKSEVSVAAIDYAVKKTINSLEKEEHETEHKEH